ncbi:polynucleotide adenylyltransferase PcnB [Hahella aquimaris]|uniref:polynucleotide adenylyltransferase PcnB n=1 Tax=Hahella sp. HNIBRBA332 TaxID=3015983 RepID=UPI00273AAE62|nr:polynucleotide adenylyltransferase PcnB [Hahella sp. HNIBRBA332]WLQ13752.1 polynucleotide adenylyltransferase PcnB [Hahella sp. HNIBRBA332]
MLKKLMGLIKPGRKEAGAKPLKLRIIPRDSHIVSRKQISPAALKVLYRLNSANYDAFLVGGGVRDLLLGAQPKDFDVATSATPEQVREQFNNCRLIGRRFRLAHVRFGREIIEVATFRAGHQNAGDDAGDAVTSDSGQILRDNVYGNQEEDALRRDFTINALYYCVRDFSIYDYAGGIEDIEHRVLRLIGDPETRYREDPVRMLRAARFAAKLDFSIEERTASPILELGPLLLNIPSARLFEEVLKLFLSGKAVRTFEILRQFDLFKFLFPETDRLLESEHPHAEKLILQALRNTDKRIAQDKPVTPAFLYAAMLWSPMQRLQQRYLDDGLPPMQAMHKAIDKVLAQQVKHTALPKRFSQPMREIWELQLRLPRKQSKRLQGLVEHPRFRAAYDFLVLREQSGEDLQGLGEWWTRYQEADDQGRSKLQQQGPKRDGSGGRRRPRRRPRRTNNSAPSQ